MNDIDKTPEVEALRSYSRQDDNVIAARMTDNGDVVLVVKTMGDEIPHHIENVIDGLGGTIVQDPESGFLRGTQFIYVELP